MRWWGVRYFSDGQYKEGGAFLFHGSADGLSETPDWIGQMDQAGAQFGYAVSGAGDVNRDGYADVIVGAPYFEDSSENLSEGGIFLYYGSADGLNPTPGWAASGGMAEARLGWSVSAAGDVNYDGYPDLAAGAPGWDGRAYVEGHGIFVYHGSGNGPSLGADWSHVGWAPYTGYGEAVAGRAT
jgi:hypothetical protein